MVLVIVFIFMFSNVGDWLLPRFLADMFIIIKSGKSSEHTLL